jgi:hypothetical protein
MDREVALLRQYLDALKKQKRGLMQLLLTGKLKITEPRLSPVGSVHALDGES